MQSPCILFWLAPLTAKWLLCCRAQYSSNSRLCPYMCMFFCGWSVTAAPADCRTWLGSRHIQGVESSVACSVTETVMLLDAVSYLHVACMRLHVRAFDCGTLAVAAGPASPASIVLKLLVVVVSGAAASVACQVLNPSQAQPAGFPCVAGRSHCTTVCGVAAAMNPSSSGMAVPQHAVHVDCCR